MQIIGTCSLCGGPVEIPEAYVGVPTKTCRDCGAVPAPGYGPVIQMVGKPKGALDYVTIEEKHQKF